MALEPYSRDRYNKALITNAALDPFAVVLLTLVLIAGIVLGNLAILLPVGLVLYALAAGRTYFDTEVADKVLERERSKHRKALEEGRVRLRPDALAPPIGQLLGAALQREQRVRDAIQSAELPYEEVLTEVEGFVRTMEDTARRAQLLYEALSENPPPQVEERLARLARDNDPARAELIQALTYQMKVLHKMEGQLKAFYDRMERILVELDTVRGNLVSASASTDVANQQQLAHDVRDLREQVGALADGMEAAYESPEATAPGGPPAA